jgi:hypothetical protein
MIARLTARDLELFKLLAKYPYLPADDIHAWVGGGHQAIVKRLNILTRKPNSYLNRPHQQRNNADANYRKLIYELDERGRTALADLGLHYVKKYHHNFAHELMACRIMFSFELALREHAHVRMIEWPEIVETLPTGTLKRDEPHTIPVTIHSHGKDHNLDLAADWKPFGIERKDDGHLSFRYFPGIEADTGTEPIEAANYRADIHRKFLAYLTICNDHIYESHFNIPHRSFYAPFITGSRTRMEHMMTLLHKITHGKGHPAFLFKTFPPLTSFELKAELQQELDSVVKSGKPGKKRAPSQPKLPLTGAA